MCIRDRIDIGVAHHELLEDIVLDRTGELVEGAALLQTRDDVERQDRQCMVRPTRNRPSSDSGGSRPKSSSPQDFKINGKRITINMKRFNTQTRFVPLKIDEDFNVSPKAPCPCESRSVHILCGGR